MSLRDEFIPTPGEFAHALASVVMLSVLWGVILAAPAFVPELAAVRDVVTEFFRSL